MLIQSMVELLELCASSESNYLANDIYLDLLANCLNFLAFMHRVGKSMMKLCLSQSYNLTENM